jgi:hypothetical protein
VADYNSEGFLLTYLLRGSKIVTSPASVEEELALIRVAVHINGHNDVEAVSIAVSMVS